MPPWLWLPWVAGSCASSNAVLMTCALGHWTVAWFLTTTRTNPPRQKATAGFDDDWGISPVQDNQDDSAST